MAQLLSKEADLLVLDRTFWKISFVAREMYNKTAQKLFCLVGGVQTAYVSPVPEFILNNTPTIIF